MSALAQAFTFLSQHYDCVGVSFKGMNPGEIPHCDYEWVTTDDEAAYRIWELLEMYAYPYLPTIGRP